MPYHIYQFFTRAMQAKSFPPPSTFLPREYCVPPPAHLGKNASTKFSSSLFVFFWGARNHKKRKKILLRRSRRFAATRRRRVIGVSQKFW